MSDSFYAGKTKLDDLIDLAALSVFEFDHDIKIEMTVSRRTMPYHCMTYLRSGQAILVLRGQKLICRPGTVALIPAGEIHDHIVLHNEEDPAEFLWWHFTYSIADIIDVLKLFVYPTVFTMKKGEQFERTFEQYLKIRAQETSVSNKILANAKGLEIMALLFDSMLPKENAWAQRQEIPVVFYEIISDIVTQTDKKINLKELSARFHMHPTYISNRFKHFFGITPSRMHMEVLTGNACQLLCSTNKSVAEIAQQLGYGNASAFSQLFLRMRGCTPSEFRRTCNKKTGPR